MRAQKVLKLDDNRAVTLNELRVRDARRIMAQAKALENMDVKALLADQFHEIGSLLGDCIQMPDGETLDDLSFSEVGDVIEGLLEINAAFLDLLGLAGLEKLLPKTPSSTSTVPASPSSSEDTAA